MPRACEQTTALLRAAGAGVREARVAQPLEEARPTRPPPAGCDGGGWRRAWEPDQASRSRPSYPVRTPISRPPRSPRRGVRGICPGRVAAPASLRSLLLSCAPWLGGVAASAPRVGARDAHWLRLAWALKHSLAARAPLASRLDEGRAADPADPLAPHKLRARGSRRAASLTVGEAAVLPAAVVTPADVRLDQRAAAILGVIAADERGEANRHQ